jgi:hypothetical protein
MITAGFGHGHSLKIARGYDAPMDDDTPEPASTLGEKAGAVLLLLLAAGLLFIGTDMLTGGALTGGISQDWKAPCDDCGN